MAKEKPTGMAVRLDMDVVETARIVAAYRGETISEILSSILRPALHEMEEEEVEKRRYAVNELAEAEKSTRKATKHLTDAAKKMELAAKRIGHRLDKEKKTSKASTALPSHDETTKTSADDIVQSALRPKTYSEALLELDPGSKKIQKPH